MHTFAEGSATAWVPTALTSSASASAVSTSATDSMITPTTGPRASEEGEVPLPTAAAAATVPPVPTVRHSTDELLVRTSDWLAFQLRECVSEPVTIRDALLRGRGLSVDEVLTARALHDRSPLPTFLRWGGPESSVADQLVKLARCQRTLLHVKGEEAREVRFRISLQSMGLGETLLTYAATEFVDPRVMDRRLSLDVLCHPGEEIVPVLVLKLGLARAAVEELTSETCARLSLEGDLWASASAAWERDMEHAWVHSKRWAETITANAGASGFRSSSGR